MRPTNVEKGAQQRVPWRCGRSGAALVARRSTACLELLRIERPPAGLREHSVDPPVACYAALPRNPGEPLVGPYAG